MIRDWGVFTLHCGDNRDVLRSMPDACVDSVVCDPPYGLAFMGKRWDHDVPGADTWAEVLRVLKPGGHLLAFFGTRTYHRGVVQVEDAGFEIRDQIGWAFGSGFPKSHNGEWGGTALKPAYEPLVVARKPEDFGPLATAVQEALWKVVSLVETDTSLCALLLPFGFSSTVSLLSERLAGLSSLASKCTTETRNAMTTDLRTLKSCLSATTLDAITPDSTLKSGRWCAVLDAISLSRSVLANCERLHGTTALDSATESPANEGGGPEGRRLSPNWRPIVMARKPLIGTVAANHAVHGTGGLNIDGCRVAFGAGDTTASADSAGQGAGRSTANHDAPAYGKGLGGVVAPPHDLGRWPANLIHDGSDEVLAAFPQAVGQIADASSSSSSRKTQNVYGAMKRGNEPSADSDNEGVVGFRMKPGARRNDAGSAARFYYCAKASRTDRNEGCEGLTQRVIGTWGGDDDLSAGKSSTLPRANTHPTVKPTDLMRYLCRLVTPAGGVVLDPFMGSGSTGKAAVLEGFRFIGIELDPQYVEIAERRIATAIFGPAAVAA
jgi:DNA modification methylase